jgi:ribonuclease HI
MFAKLSQKIYPEIILGAVPMYKLQFDGCSKGNPGPAGAGMVIYKDGIEEWSSYLFLGNKKTNNEAEYEGLIMGLRYAQDKGIKEIDVEGDSILVIKQMKGEYKVNSPNLIHLYETARDLTKSFDKILFRHIYREKNKRADELSNQPFKKSDPKLSTM